jgi:apoptosis-inducing factor 3
MESVVPDLEHGVTIDSVRDGGMIRGRVGNEEILVARCGKELFAISDGCTHYHSSLADGLLVDDTLRCPMHHACFSLRTGRALHAPAIDSVACWRVELLDGRIFVREKLAPASLRASGSSIATSVKSIVIVGGGAAGLAAAAALRRQGFGNAVTIISADDSPPYDRANLSKDYLAGAAPEEWMPLRTPEFYSENQIDLMLNARVTSLDPVRKRLTLEDGRDIGFDNALLATGADAVKIAIPGATADSLHYLRTFADCRAILAKSANAKQVVVLGASFIALEAAASLRARGIAVHVVGKERIPMERVLGPELGRFIRQLHESKGVVFHLETSIEGIAGRTVTLTGGAKLDADFVIAGVGVRPSLSLATNAGLATNNGVVVDEYLQTSAVGIYAAGDIAQWPDPHSGSRIRVEHWVVAQRQAEVAARNMLGARERFVAVPFFWSQHYEVPINYIGHAEKWDAIELDGDPAKRDCAVRYLSNGRTLAMATIGRDRLNLEMEVAMEKTSNS